MRQRPCSCQSVESCPDVEFCAAGSVLRRADKDRNTSTNPPLQSPGVPSCRAGRKTSTRHCLLKWAERENSDVKKKILLLVSLGAMVLSAALLTTPASANFTSHCTSCTVIDSSGNTVTSGCHIAPIDACFCPLSGKIVKDNCLFFP